MSVFTWQNVTDNSAQAVQAVTNAQNSAANRIEKGAQTLINLAKDKEEKVVEDFDKIAEFNLQKELDKVNAIDSVEELQKFDVDPTALREQFGAQFGKDGRGISRLEAAVDAQRSALIGEEEQLDARQTRLDTKTTRNLVAEFMASVKPGTKSQDMLRDYQAFIGKRPDAPSTSLKDGLDLIRTTESAKNKFTDQNIQDRQISVANANQQIKALTAEEDAFRTTLDNKYGGEDSFIPATIDSVDAHVADFVEGVQGGDPEFEGGWFGLDATKGEDFGTYRANLAAVSKGIVNTFVGAGNEAGQAIEGAMLEGIDAQIAQLQKNIGSQTKDTSKLSGHAKRQAELSKKSFSTDQKNQMRRELQALTEQRGKLAGAGAGVVFSKQMLKDILSDELLFDEDFTGIEGDFDGKKFEAKLAKALRNPKSRTYKAIVRAYRNQTQGQIIYGKLTETTAKKSKQEARREGLLLPSL